MTFNKGGINMNNEMHGINKYKSSESSGIGPLVNIFASAGYTNILEGQLKGKDSIKKVSATSNTNTSAEVTISRKKAFANQTEIDNFKRIVASALRGNGKDLPSSEAVWPSNEKMMGSNNITFTVRRV